MVKPYSILPMVNLFPLPHLLNPMPGVHFATMSQGMTAIAGLSAHHGEALRRWPVLGVNLSMDTRW